MSSNPTTYAERVFRTPLGWRLGSLAGVVILAAVCGVMIVFAFISFAVNWALGLFMTALACFMVALTGYVLRDFLGKWGLRVVLGPDAVTLDLPSGRSLIHHPPTQHLTVPYADIDAIDTRLEAYGSLGMETMQRAYALHRKSGELIFLFEERALATAMESSMFQDIVAALVAKPGIKVRDLGMVEGRGGFLNVWGTHTPDWATPSLPAARQMKLWARAAATGSAAMIGVSTAGRAWYGSLRAPRNSRSQSPPAKPK